jgi:hypothetical protein
VALRIYTAPQLVQFKGLKAQQFFYDSPWQRWMEEYDFTVNRGSWFLNSGRYPITFFEHRDASFKVFWYLSVGIEINMATF